MLCHPLEGEGGQAAQTASAEATTEIEWTVSENTSTTRLFGVGGEQHMPDVGEAMMAFR